MFLRLFAVFLAVSSAVVALQAKSPTETLNEIMGDRIYAEAGIDSLSETEKATLLRWIQDRDTTVESAIREEVNEDLEARIQGEVETRLKEEDKRRMEEADKAAKSMFGFLKRDDSEIDEIHSRIVGTFDGWSGNSYFPLENGQVWKQRSGGRYFKRMDSPEVTIRKESFGYWLVLDKYGARVAVTRVR